MEDGAPGGTSQGCDGPKAGKHDKANNCGPLEEQPRMGRPRSPRRWQDAKIKEITIRGFKQGRGKRGSGGRITHDNMEGDSPRPSGCWVLSSAIVDATGGDTRIFIGGWLIGRRAPRDRRLVPKASLRVQLHPLAPFGASRPGPDLTQSLIDSFLLSCSCLGTLRPTATCRESS